MNKGNHMLVGFRRLATALAVCAALCCGAAMAAALPASDAWAATVTVNEPSTVTQDVSYKAFRVFNATVAADNKATDVTWNDAHKNAVLAYLGTQGYDTWLTNEGFITSTSTEDEKTAAREKPQNAAEFIAGKISGSAPSGSNVKDGDSFAMGLAKALASGTADAQSSGGKIECSAQGFWLIVADASTVGADPAIEAGTAPIWLPVGSEDKTVESKTALPTFTKQVKEDKTGTFGTYADANVGQELDYKITVTLPSNINAFATYPVKVVDTLGAGLEIPADMDVSVKVGTTEVSGAATKSGNVVTVNIDDVKKHGGTAGTQVTIEYKANLASDAAKGSAGNVNSAKLTYPKDPVSGEKAETVALATKVYTYQLEVKKVALEDGATLIEGAKFKVHAGNASSTSYVQADGSIADTAYEFTTGSDGTFQMPGLDEGTYTLEETYAPEAYDKVGKPITLTVESTIGADGLTKLDMAARCGDAADDGKFLAMSASVNHDANGAAATLTVKDPKHQTVLPVTGMTPSQTATVAGAVLFALGICVAVVCRRMARK